jgi:tight adherence protein C
VTTLLSLWNPVAPPSPGAVVTWAAALLAGGAVALLLVAAAELAGVVPGGDAAGRDRPPLAFRLAWPLLRVLAFHLAWLGGTAGAARRGAALRRAGLDYALTPTQFIAAQIVAALLGAGLPWLASGGTAAGMLAALTGGFGWVYPQLWLHRAVRARQLALLKAMPFFLDILTLAVEAGLNLTGALHQASEKLPAGPLTQEIDRLLRDIRAGKPRVDALQARAAELDYAPFSSLVGALVQGELTGAGLAPVLRAQSEQRRGERFLRAEKLALEAPVKMLGPLIFCIFPCTFVIIGFPIAVRLLGAGL